MLAAVSGGSDSSALLLLLREHLAKHAPRLRLIAVTVDHGLREGSAAEAAGVAAFAASLGVAHRTSRWEGDKPQTGLPAAAREARYRLLRQAADDAGARIVFTGHTADDQAETVAMRAARGEGRGLAGMAPATLFDGSVWICRPLLGTRRDALRHYLRARGSGWVDDPTNADMRFERVRLREVLQGNAGPLMLDKQGALVRRGSPAPSAFGSHLSPRWRERKGGAVCGLSALPLPPAGGEVDRPELVEGRDGVEEPPLRSAPSIGGAQPLDVVDKLLRLMEQMSEMRCRIAEQAATLLQTCAISPAHGLIRLLPDLLEQASRFAAVEALRFLLATIGGREFPVDAERTGALLDRLQRSGRQTLGGVVVERRSDAVFLFREHRGIARAAPGTVFDGRFRLSSTPLPGHVEPWGHALDREQTAKVADAPRSLVRAALATAPAFRTEDRRLLPLDAAGIEALPLVAPFSRFLPGFDLALAQALARLVGAPAFPASPYRGHFAGAG